MKKLYLSFLAFMCLLVGANAQEAPPPKFINKLEVPPLIVYNPQGSYDLDAIQTTHDFNPDIPNDPLNGVTTFCFEDFNNPGTTTILGPTINWQYKANLNPSVLNRLDERTTCHWHGAHVPNTADGGPYQMIMADQLWEPEFQVLDKSATMWYHPHAMGLTYKHVQMGMSGMIYVEDPVDDPSDPDDDILAAIHDILPTDYNGNDFPLIFQTKFFEFDSTTNRMQIKSELGFKKDYEYMVNGIIDPVMDAPANMIRLRLLNGDGKYSFNFKFTRDDGSTFPAQMIATDAGYMDRSYQLPEILMAPGERTEWLLDLRGLEGDTLYVRNMVSTIPGADLPCTNNGQRGIIGDSCTTQGYAADRDLLRIVVGPSNPSYVSPIIGFPINLYPSEAPPLSEVDNTRTKTFRKDNFGADGNLFNIDSTLMNMMVVNDVVRLDDTEVWTIDNTTNVGHPWHIHDIHFWVTEVIDENGDALNPDDYPEIFKGPKDNVLVQPFWKVSYITTFADYGVADPTDPTNSYMYHCHILPHEDKGMMGTFVVWDGTPVNVDETAETAIMQVYPNPAQDVIYMQGASTKVSTLNFISLDGQLIKSMSLPAFEGAIQIDVDQLPKGMVILDWQRHEGRATSRVMIIR
ncbi:MAG: multicopper oxidase domain-containing protein [Bacteroidota bacterium]